MNNFGFNKYREVVNFFGFVVCKGLKYKREGNSDCKGKVNESGK